MRAYKNTRTFIRIAGLLNEQLSFNIDPAMDELVYYSKKTDRFKWKIISSDSKCLIQSEFGIGHLLKYGFKLVLKENLIEVTPEGLSITQTCPNMLI